MQLAHQEVTNRTWEPCGFKSAIVPFVEPRSGFTTPTYPGCHPRYVIHQITQVCPATTSKSAGAVEYKERISAER